MESIEPIRKPSGCLKASGRFGCFMAICSVLFIVFCIWMTISSEEHMNELRDEYAASSQEYEDALAAYNADSAHLNAEFNRISARIDEANAKGDSVLAAQLTDSLSLYAEPEWNPRGAIGVNIGAAFFVFFAVCALVPLTVGIILYLVYRYRKRQYQRSTML